MMIRIKWLAFFLLVYFALFLNAGRIVIQLGWHIAINPIIYPLGILAMLIILLGAGYKSMLFIYKILFFTTLAHAVASVYLHPAQGLLLRLNLLNYSAELSLLITLILLTYHFSHAVGDVEQAMEDFLFNHIQSDIKSFADMRKDIEHEVYRCRRNNQAFQLIIVETIAETPEDTNQYTGKNRLSEDMLNYLAGRYQSNKVGALLRSMLRRTDILAEQIEKKRFVLLCPSTTSPIPKPNALRQRIKKTVWEQLKFNVICGAAIFPEDSMSFEGLMEKAELRLVDNSPLELVNEDIIVTCP